MLKGYNVLHPPPTVNNGSYKYRGPTWKLYSTYTGFIRKNGTLHQMDHLFIRTLLCYAPVYFLVKIVLSFGK